MEIFKDIEGYEGLYQVSNYGRVLSLGNGISTNSLTKLKKFISIGITPKGYTKVKLSKQGVKKFYSVHRLVAKAFIDNPIDKPQVNHIDCNKLNNHVSNLEWCTSLENISHSVKNGLQENRKGFDNSCSISVKCFDKSMG